MDPDNDALTYSAKFINGTDFPVDCWFTFNIDKFTGTPTKENRGKFKIEVTASDLVTSVST